jgi:FAD/FMN-containing dehydrogenase/Fe-S oxidoreductase
VTRSATATDFADLRREVLARQLRKQLRGEVRFDRTSRRLYSTDASIYQIEPLGVVLPRTVEDIVLTVQLAGEMRIPITARGGGTSLSGQSIGPGIVIDCSKYLNRILDVDVAGHSARVQPGMILEQLNRALAPQGLQFGPEVSTANRANLGGMIGNNSAGARSIVYGMTCDHLRRLSAVLSDGTQTEFTSLSLPEWERRAATASFEGSLYAKVARVILDIPDEIQRRFPAIPRRVSGYNLDRLARALTGGNGAPLVGLQHLIAGSEGTLAIVTEADLNLVDRPKARGLLVPHFSSLGAALDILADCLELQPSAVELIDKMLIDLARANRTYREMMSAVVGRPAALLMVEFTSNNEREVLDRIERLTRKLRGAMGLTALVPALNPAARDPLWNLRTAAAALLYALPGEGKPIAFVEDAAVAPQKLPEFAGRFKELLHHHGTDGSFYGHASVGCLHIRPVLNLKDPADVDRMRQITDDVTSLVLEFGGALSGEHGDGLARSEWNRKMFGPKVYEAFRKIKGAFDPNSVLNPGKIVDAPAMTENLRYGPGYKPFEPETLFDYSQDDGFVRSVELCNGSGVCRKLQGGNMCPSFRATREEQHSTRARANILRLALTSPQPLKSLRSQATHDVLDLCLMCKACKSECPSHVDLAKLKAEFLQIYYADRPRPLGHQLLARIHQVNRLGSRFAASVNWLQKRASARWLLEKATGIDRRRSLPRLHGRHFRRWFARHVPAASAGSRGRVILLDDCFNTFQDPAIGQAAVRVLERAGYKIDLADLTCCCRPMISKGFLAESRSLIQSQATALSRRLDDDTPILGLEPSCVLTLVDEWPELLPGPATKRIARAAELAESWLAAEVNAGRCKLPLEPRMEKCLLHGHCHQKAVCGTGGTVAALQLIPRIAIEILDAGCCGMAGSFGYEKEHYDLSVAIANLELLPALAAQPDALVVAPGTSCRHQIHDLAHRKALHPLELIERTLETT